MSVLMAFTARQVTRLSNISERRLRYWEETKVFCPMYVERRESGPFRKIYSFRDLVSLRTLSMLRVDHRLHLHELRRASEYLRKYSDSPWSDLSLRIHGDRLVFRDPDSGRWTTADSTGQLLLTIDLGKISKESESEARKLMLRSPDHYGMISRNRNIMSNAWVISGTRIPIAAVVGLRNAGMTDSQILRQYPTLANADIDAVIEFREPAEQVA